MWTNYYYLEARRLAAERTVNTELAEMAREAALYREARRAGSESGFREPHPLRRAAARLALAVGRTALRIARSLDERVVGDGAGVHSGASPLG
jgi:hypothetical protein